jgi:hypothetical protein
MVTELRAAGAARVVCCRLIAAVAALSGWDDDGGGARSSALSEEVVDRNADLVGNPADQNRRDMCGSPSSSNISTTSRRLSFGSSKASL